LGTEFHRWLREHHEALGLKQSDDFVRFVERDLNFYTRQHLRLRQAENSLIPGLEEIYSNAGHHFTLQYPLLLAPLVPEDDEPTIARKLRVVGVFLDILLARRLWNFRSITYSALQYAMFVIMRSIRGKSPSELARILRERLDAEEETFAANDRFRLHQQNRQAVRELLARLTDHVERAAGLSSRFEEYVAEGKNRYEVEHIWANHPARHRDEFPHAQDFAEYRHRIGGLLLLPKAFNASYGDLPYAKKLPHYNSQNLLARSLHPQCYEHNPGFLAYVKTTDLPFRAHQDFTKADLDARQELYQRLAEDIWNPARLDQAAGA
jgi:quinol monooxygenase YgiN